MEGKQLSEDRFHIILQLLRTGGLPVYVEKVSILYKLYTVLTKLVTYSTFLPIFLGATMEREDLKRALISIRHSFGYFELLWCFSYISLFRQKFDRLLKFTEQFEWEELPTIDPDTGEITMAGWITKTQHICKKVLQMTVAFHFIQSIYRMITNRELVFEAWYPFDSKASPAFEIINFIQLFSSYIMVAVLYGSISLFATIVCVAGSQLEKLRIALVSLKQGEKMRREIGKCIRHHHEILEYTNEIEESLSIYLFMQMLILFVATCFNAFSAVVSWGDNADVSQAIIAYCVLTAHLLVMCWFGSKLTEKAEGVRQAAWECDWVGTPISFQKSIILIIANGNKDLALTAGKFFPLSNVTLLDMMSQSLSFFMFLLEVKDRNST